VGNKDRRVRLKKKVQNRRPTYTQKVKLPAVAPQLDTPRSPYGKYPFKTAQVDSSTETGASARTKRVWRMNDGVDGRGNPKYIFGEVVRPNSMERALGCELIFVTPVLDWRGCETGMFTRRQLKGSSELLKKYKGLQQVPA
jgi:hypothetical protein